MNVKILLMRAAALYMPDMIKKIKLKELFRLTADAFQTEMPELHGLSFSDCLQRYAAFSKEQAEYCLLGKGRCTPAEVKSRLNKNSFLLGKHLKKSLHIRDRNESTEALSMIYRLIGIDFQCGRGSVTLDGFVVRRCLYSSCYTSEICRLISSLDEGLAAGLTGGKLCFKQRITDGAEFCKGSLLYCDNEEKTG